MDLAPNRGWDRLPAARRAGRWADRSHADEERPGGAAEGQIRKGGALRGPGSHYLFWTWGSRHPMARSRPRTWRAFLSGSLVGP